MLSCAQIKAEIQRITRSSYRGLDLGEHTGQPPWFKGKLEGREFLRPWLHRKDKAHCLLRIVAVFAKWRIKATCEAEV